MIKYIFTAFFLLFGLSANEKKSFSYDQLPMSSSLMKSFPKLNATCFIVCSVNSNVVLHHKNSDLKIHSGSFNEEISKYLNSTNLSEINTFIKNSGAKNTNLSTIKTSDEDKTTLYDMCVLFVDKNFEKINIKSEMSGFGCIVKYKNTSNCEFVIAVSGINTIDQLNYDIKELLKWLDNFIEYTVFSKNDYIASVPVLYGANTNKLDIKLTNNIKLIMTKGKTHNVKKRLYYKTITTAPVNKDTVLGIIELKTQTFEKPVKINLYANIDIKRGSRLKTTLDSISYIILGTPF